MKILFICHHTASRSKHRQMNIARYLSSQGHKVTLMVTSEDNRIFGNTTYIDGIKVVQTPDLLVGRLRRGFDIYNTIWRSLYILKNLQNFDIVHLFETRAVTIFPGLLFKLRKKVPLFIDWVDWWGDGGLISVNRPAWYQFTFGYIESFFETYFRRFGDVNTVISSGLKTRATNLLGEDKAVVKLRQGVNTEEFMDIGIATARAKLNVDNDAKIFGFASQDSFYDFKYLFNTLDDLLNSIQILPNIKFLVTGHIPDEIKSEISTRKLKEYFIFTGFVSNEDYPAYLSACDYFILPFPKTNYNLGRFPNKFGEYISIGRPIVTHSFGSIKEFENSKIGYFASAEAVSLADECIQLLDETHSVSFDFSSVQQALDWRTVLSSLPNLYIEQIELRS